MASGVEGSSRVTSTIPTRGLLGAGPHASCARGGAWRVRV